ncbi:MAG: RNA polymerase sigma factor [Flavobacteriaceae bacterium]
MCSNINDQDPYLVSSYINGNQKSLEKLINKYRPKIFNFIQSKISNRDISEDIFQETFIKVINTLKRGLYNEEGKFISWVMRIAHNLIVDHFRKSSRIKFFKSKDDFDVFKLISDDIPNIENTIINEQVNIDLNKMILELPYDQREVIEMRLFREMSFKDISELTNVSINTALGRMRYAIINLRKLASENQIILSA